MDLDEVRPGRDAEVPADAKIILSGEHDRCEWVTASELTRCLPPWVGSMYLEVLEQLSIG